MAKVRFDPGLAEAIRRMKTITALAKAIRLTPQAVAKWRRVPAGNVIVVEQATGIPRKKLRPDLYAAPRLKRSRPAAHV